MPGFCVSEDTHFWFAEGQLAVFVFLSRGKTIEEVGSEAGLLSSDPVLDLGNHSAHSLGLNFFLCKLGIAGSRLRNVE